MALTVKSRAPRFRVQIHTKGTVSSTLSHDTASTADTALLASIVSISTTRRMGQAGTFQIVLLPRRDKLHRWQDIVGPMDYVEIDLSPSGAVGAGASTTSAKFRGFVDSVEMVWTLEDGRPFPAIRISGRDYSKLLVDMQLYLLGNVPPSMQVLLTWLQGISALDPPTTGSTEISKATASSASAANLRPDQVINSLFTNWLLPFSSAIESALTITTPIQLDASFAQLDATQLGLMAIRPPMLVDNFDPLRTAVWTAMGEYSHAPWYELYVEDYIDAPYLVLRPAPWRDIHGAWVQPAAWSSITPGAASSSSSPRAPRFIAVDAHEITAIALGRFDASASDDSVDSASPGGSGGSGGAASSGGGQVNNFFLTYPAPFETVPAAARSLGSPLLTGNNPSICGSPSLTSSGAFGASDWHEFGWRPMERWSAYSDFPNNDPTTASIGSELNRRLGAAFSFGEYLESGVITIVRDPSSAQFDPIHIGDYISLTGGLDEFGIDWAPGTLFYVESVSHDFRIPTGTGDGSYTMMLGVTRGEAYLDRYPNLRNTSILTPLKNAAPTATP
jgi:hypothetical protein